MAVATAPRRAGQHARETQKRLAKKGIAAMVVIFMTGLVAGLVLGFTSGWFLLVQLAVIGALLLMDRRLPPIVDRWRQGAAGEEHVGEVIAGLVEAGWLAIHDVSLGRGNIDHVLIGPAGLLTVETKSHGGRIDVTRLDERWLKQAYAEAKLLAVISGREVAPLLVFSRAYLHPRPVVNRRGVTVLPARMLAGHLARRPTVLGPDEVREVHARLSAALEPA